MNEQLQNAVATILERAISGIDSSVEFMQAELPEVIEQLLMWYGIKSSIIALVGLLLLFVMVKFDISMFKRIRSDKSNDSFEIVMMYGVIGTLCRVAYLVPYLMINLDWLQIWIAPKIWLMEYAATIVK